jgi:hypothetical protein
MSLSNILGDALSNSDLRTALKITHAGAALEQRRLILGTFAAVRLGIVVATTVSLAAPAAAAAQDASLTANTPQGRPVLLNVRDSGGLRCLSTKVGDEPVRRTSPCVAAPRNADEDARSLHVVYKGTPERLAIIHGTASSQSSTLRVTMRDGRRVLVRPQGPNGAYLRVVTGRPPIATVHALDRRGAVRGAADFDPRAVRPSRGPYRLRRTTDEHGALADLTAFTAKLYLDNSTRRQLHTCVGVSTRSRIPRSDIEPGYPGGSACTTSSRRVKVKFAASCEARRILVFGIAPTAVSRLTLVAASGKRFAAITARFTPLLKRSGRAFVFSLPDPGAIDRLEAYDRRGRRLVSLALSTAGSGCGSSSRS